MKNTAKVIDKALGFLEVEVAGVKFQSGNSCSSSREVFVFDDFVVKFDTSQACGEQCENEIEFYTQHLEAGDEVFFPALLGYGKYDGRWFLIQERVKPKMTGVVPYQYETAPSESEVAELNGIINKYDIDDVSASFREGTVRNCTLTETGIKIYDIGYSGGQ